MLGEKLLGTFWGVLDRRLRCVGPFIFVWHFIYLLVTSAAFKTIMFSEDNQVQAAKLDSKVKNFLHQFSLNCSLIT